MTKNGPLDFGIYINADDIASNLLLDGCKFSQYELRTDAKEFSGIALQSGLIQNDFSTKLFHSAFSLTNNTICLTNKRYKDKLAQIIADFLRKKLLVERKKFSFETVFSHPSKVDIMKEANKMGYKVYLYFVSTNSPEINKYRVKLRVAKKGHDVPEDRITSRYYRSLELLYPASQLAYQTFFFDNSVDGEPAKMINHFKIVQGKKKWDKKIMEKDAPDWFIKYYARKVKHNK